jgi:hypothetical protein
VSPLLVLLQALISAPPEQLRLVAVIALALATPAMVWGLARLVHEINRLVHEIKL